MFSRVLLLALIFSLYITTGRGGDEASDKPAIGKTALISLHKKIDALLSNPLFTSASIGIRIISLHNGKSIYAFNQDKLFHPASNQKIIITSAGLHLLEKNFIFRTNFGTDGVLMNDILEGNFIIQGAGDPLICTADLDSIAGSLLHRGIRVIRGNIIGNVTYFDTLFWGRGWMWDDEPYPESPFISPLSVNKNSVKFSMQPGIYERDTILWTQEPQTTFISVINKGYTSTDTSLPSLSLIRPTRNNIVTIEGAMPPTDTGRDISISVWLPEQYFLCLLRERLESAGIRCIGSLAISNDMASIVFASLEHPLDSVLHRINKESDNLAAENLLKTIGSEYIKKPGTSADGLAAVKGFLYTYGIDTASISMADGSGASWYNAVSPRVITEILLKEYKQKETFRRFYESLSIAGTDGTLKNRMRKPRLRDKVYAKTGSLTGVNCISGYVTMKNGTLAAFSIMVNHFTCNNADVRRLQDEIIEAVALSDLK